MGHERFVSQFKYVMVDPSSTVVETIAHVQDVYSIVCISQTCPHPCNLSCIIWTLAVRLMVVQWPFVVRSPTKKTLNLLSQACEVGSLGIYLARRLAISNYLDQSPFVEAKFSNLLLRLPKAISSFNTNKQGSSLHSGYLGFISS